MRIAILSIGQTKSGPDSVLCEDYEKRIRNQGRAIGITAVTSNMLAESRRGHSGLHLKCLRSF